LGMYIQGVDNVFDMKWNDKYTYGYIHKHDEYEYSKYNFEVANTQMLFKLFDMFEEEVQNCLNAKLVRPAYDYCMKCSHVFNLLDARNAISVTERATFIKKVREMVAKVARLYVEGEL